MKEIKANKKVVIIGGVAGGASCAARLRRLDEAAEIILLERGDYISYANCGLPYHVGDVIKSRDALLVSNPEQMRTRFNIDVRTGNEVVKINPADKSVRIRRRLEVKSDAQEADGGAYEEYEESYDKLVISTGSSPLRPSIPGIDSDLIQTLWTVPDTDRVRQMARESGIKSTAVIGGGFIGLEVAENLRLTGLKVDILEALDQIMPPADPEMAKLLQENIVENGVGLHLGDPVDSFEEISLSGSRAAGDSAEAPVGGSQRSADGKRAIKIKTRGGKEIITEFVVLSIGLRPNTELARDAGLEINERGGVVVDEYMRTSDSDIYAVGDIAEIEDFTTGNRMQYQLAGPANKQGRIAADNINSRDGAAEKYEGTQATSIAKVFDLAIGMTGQSEKALVRNGMVKGKDFETVYVTQNQHAGYYPGALPLTIKLIYEAGGGKILGAQIVGRDGVDKRIDTISVAARLGADAVDLAKLELAYAPPYSSAKDPVNMVGFTVRNVADGLVSFSEWDEVEGVQLLDVREDAERLAYEIPGAVNIPFGSLRERIDEIDREKTVVVFCAIGVRSYSAARVLMQHGFKDVKLYPAGTRFYQSTHYEDYMDEYMKGSGGGAPDSDGGAGMTGDGVAEGDDSAPTLAIRLNCSGMQCPGPIMKVYEAIQTLDAGQTIEVTASDPGFRKDIVAWCRRTGNTVIVNEQRGADFVAVVRKGNSGQGRHSSAANGGEGSGALGDDSGSGDSEGERAYPTHESRGKTIIVFDGDMDKVMASFIIANGAAAMGKPVTMFFTFWGLTVLRRHEKVAVRKSPVEKMFGAMLPRGTGKLKLSKMNMGGMGTRMMKSIMKQKNVASLDELIASALRNGVKLVACTMSMDVMGIKQEELIDGVELGGVGYYLGDAEESDVNLFI